MCSDAKYKHWFDFISVGVFHASVVLHIQCSEKRPYLVGWFGSVCLTSGLLHSWFLTLFLQVGTSSVVYPAAMFAPQVSARGVPVAEFNMEATPATNRFR